MPEGDSVKRTARRMAALEGHEVTRFDLRVPAFATRDLRGETVQSSAARGKHLLLRIGDQTLHTHLRMEGEWAVHPVGTRWRRPAHQVRALVGSRTLEAVGFDLGIVEVLPTSHEADALAHLGPDPLGDDWDAVEAAHRLAADPRAAHVALLDQRNVAGFGTEYGAELLFLTGVAPTRPMTEADTLSLVELGARTIRRNVELPIRSFTGVNRRGQNHWVYRRERQPCRRCGTAIQHTRLGADPTKLRDVFWCPTCQR
ncbi:MAG: DNA-formamidopyrimidine glycosylase family protein [Microbacterium sp.]